MATFQQSFSRFQDSLTLLENSLQKDLSDPTMLAGAIKHFELTYETCWKSLKGYLFEKLTIETLNPRHAFQEAYQQKILSDENTWLAIMKDRNFSTHVYLKADAVELIQRIRTLYLSHFIRVCQFLKDQT